MTDLALFLIGTVVFFVGGVGMVLYGLDMFQLWSTRQTSKDEDPHLEDGTVRDVISLSSRRRAA